MQYTLLRIRKAHQIRENFISECELRILNVNLVKRLSDNVYFNLRREARSLYN